MSSFHLVRLIVVVESSSFVVRNFGKKRECVYVSVKWGGVLALVIVYGREPFSPTRGGRVCKSRQAGIMGSIYNYFYIN